MSTSWARRRFADVRMASESSEPPATITSAPAAVTSPTFQPWSSPMRMAATSSSHPNDSGIRNFQPRSMSWS